MPRLESSTFHSIQEFLRQAEPTGGRFIVSRDGGDVISWEWKNRKDRKEGIPELSLADPTPLIILQGLTGLLKIKQNGSGLRTTLFEKGQIVCEELFP